MATDVCCLICSVLCSLRVPSGPSAGRRVFCVFPAAQGFDFDLCASSPPLGVLTGIPQWVPRVPPRSECVVLTPMGLRECIASLPSGSHKIPWLAVRPMARGSVPHSPRGTSAASVPGRKTMPHEWRPNWGNLHPPGRFGPNKQASPDHSKSDGPTGTRTPAGDSTAVALSCRNTSTKTLLSKPPLTLRHPVLKPLRARCPASSG